MYELFIAASAKKSIKKFPNKLRERVFEEASALKLNPYLGKKLVGKISFLHSLHFDYRGNSYRIAYQVDNQLDRIIIYLVGIREGFYKRLIRIF